MSEQTEFDPSNIGVTDDDSNNSMTMSLGRGLSNASSGGESDINSSTSTSHVASMSVGQYLGAVANLCSATLGAGILALPFAMYEAGLIFGFILLLMSAWATAASIDLIVKVCNLYGLATYESVVEKGLGRKWRQIVEISILIFCGGTAVAYVIAVGDIMERLQTVPTDSHKHLAMVLVWLCAMLPLSCLRRMQSLQCASSVGIMSIGTLLLAAVVHLFMPIDEEQSVSGLEAQNLHDFLWPNKGIFSVLQACPIFFFAFSCQVNVAQIYDELPDVSSTNTGQSDLGNNVHNSRVKSMSLVSWIAIGLCTILYGSISFVTLLDFGGGVLPNILSCYHLVGKESSLLHLAFLAMALAVIMAFPLNIFPARLSILQMWKSSQYPMDLSLMCDEDEESAKKPLLANTAKGSSYKSRDSLENQDEDIVDPLQTSSTTSSLNADTSQEQSVPNTFQHQFVTILVAGSALGLALVVPNISVVFGLLGGTTSSLLGFVVPGLLGLNIEEEREETSTVERLKVSKATSWILLIAGSVIGVVTTVVTLYATFFVEHSSTV